MSKDLQFDLPLESALSHTVFPGRSLLLVDEVARAWSCDKKHILNLIEVGDLCGIDIRTSKPARPSVLAAEHKSIRRWLRIPVSAFDTFIRERKTI